MQAHRKLQAKTMETYGEIIDLLDEVVGINSQRTGLHHKNSELQWLKRRTREEYHGYYRSVASFLAQRACQTAQANALLLRHGFQDQAFELWRTMVNLQEQLENLIGEDQEKEAEKFLNAAFSEMKFLDERAKESGSILGRMFVDDYKDDITKVAEQLQAEYGGRILKRDGWKNPDKPAIGHGFDKQFQAEIDHHYQLASKLQHGTPISTAIGADLEMRPFRDPLEHRTDGVPVQCILTGHMLHTIVSMFCTTTEEIEDHLDELLVERSRDAIIEISKFISPKDGYPRNGDSATAREEATC